MSSLGGRGEEGFWGTFVRTLIPFMRAQPPPSNHLPRPPLSVTITFSMFECRVLLLSSPWPITHPAPLSMGFSRHEYWSGLPCHFPGDLPNPGSNLHFLCWEADSLPRSRQGPSHWGLRVQHMHFQDMAWRAAGHGVAKSHTKLSG